MIIFSSLELRFNKLYIGFTVGLLNIIVLSYSYAIGASYEPYHISAILILKKNLLAASHGTRNRPDTDYKITNDELLLDLNRKVKIF